MAPSYRVWRQRSGADCRRCRAICEMGGEKPMTAAAGTTGRPAKLTMEQLIKSQAIGLGFDLVGIAKLGPAESAPMFEEWLARGYAGDMTYLERGAEKRRDTRAPFARSTSAIVVALDYGGRSPSGPVARYARGDDYHDLMTDRANELHRVIQAQLERGIAGRP